MQQLTIEELEVLRYTVSVNMFETGDDSEDIKSLHDKLVDMKAEQEWYEGYYNEDGDWVEGYSKQQ